MTEEEWSLSEGYDPNDPAMMDNPEYADARRLANLRRLIRGLDEKERLFIEGAGTDGSQYLEKT